jgi:hypothetical protein
MAPVAEMGVAATAPRRVAVTARTEVMVEANILMVLLVVVDVFCVIGVEEKKMAVFLLVRKMWLVLKRKKRSGSG